MYTDAELFEIGYHVGKYERSRIQHNISRAMDTKTERRTPQQGVREVVPRSRPRDAGKVLHYRWRKDLSLAPRSYQEGYAKGYAEPATTPIFSPYAQVDYGDYSEVPTTEQIQAKLPDPDVRTALQTTMRSFKGTSRGFKDGMFLQLDELSKQFVSGNLKWKHIDAGFIQSFAETWNIPVLEAKTRLEREFGR